MNLTVTVRTAADWLLLAGGALAVACSGVVVGVAWQYLSSTRAVAKELASTQRNAHAYAQIIHQLEPDTAYVHALLANQLNVIEDREAGEFYG